MRHVAGMQVFKEVTQPITSIKKKKLVKQTTVTSYGSPHSTRVFQIQHTPVGGLFGVAKMAWWLKGLCGPVAMCWWPDGHAPKE